MFKGNFIAGPDKKFSEVLEGKLGCGTGTGAHKPQGQRPAFLDLIVIFVGYFEVRISSHLCISYYIHTVLHSL